MFYLVHDVGVFMYCTNCWAAVLVVLLFNHACAHAYYLHNFILLFRKVKSLADFMGADESSGCICMICMFVCIGMICLLLSAYIFLCGA